MKRGFVIIISCLMMACGGNQTADTVIQKPSEISESSNQEDGFFPLTEYILGQIAEIRNQAVNPLKKTGNDSSWIKIEDLEKEFQPFLKPIIDTGNMKALFQETKFLDKTVNAYTFIYEPKTTLPDSMELRSWYVYVDPRKNNVKKIYMTKLIAGKQVQMTWEAGKSCLIRTISEQPDGKLGLEKEILYQWDF